MPSRSHAARRFLATQFVASRSHCSQSHPFIDLSHPSTACAAVAVTSYPSTPARFQRGPLLPLNCKHHRPYGSHPNAAFVLRSPRHRSIRPQCRLSLGCQSRRIRSRSNTAFALQPAPRDWILFQRSQSSPLVSYPSERCPLRLFFSPPYDDVSNPLESSAAGPLVSDANRVVANPMQHLHRAPMRPHARLSHAANTFPSFHALSIAVTCSYPTTLLRCCRGSGASKR